MKIHMVVLYLYLMILVTNGEKKKSGGRLTPEENEQRLKTCGTTKIDTPSRDNKAEEVNEWPKWVSFAVTVDQNGAGAAALTTMISPRHFLTSSQVVMNEISYTWRYNSKSVGGCSQIPQGNLEVPEEALKKLGFFKSGCLPKCTTLSVIPVTRAVILNYCGTSPRMWEWSHGVMVMEIAEDIDGGGFPCLTYDTQPKDEVFDVYSFLFKGKLDQHIYHRKLPLLNNSDRMYYKFPRYNQKEERGSPVMKLEKTGKWNLIGLGAQNSSEKETGVLRMSWLGGELCREVGVCPPDPTASPPLKPTEPPKVEKITTPTTKKAAPPPPPKTNKPKTPPVKQVPTTVKPITPAPKPELKPTVVARKLTAEENVRRLKTCGKTPIDTPSGDKTPKKLKEWPNWVSLARTREQSGVGSALTTMISPRHFLTSSQVVMHDNTTWRWNSESVESCGKDQVNLEVPDEIVRKIRFFESGKDSSIPVTRVVILDYCKIPSRVKKWSQAVMVMEIAEDIGVDGGFPCLADNSTDDVYSEGKELDVYSMSEKRGMQIIHHRKLKVTKNNTKVLQFDQYHKDGQRGGPIMDNWHGTWTLVGLGAGGKNENSFAFRISALQEQLCEVVGVCWLQDEPKLPLAKTSEPTPSKSPEVPLPPPPSDPPSTEAPPPRAPPARKPENDEDDPDYEAYLQRKKEKEEAEMYENEDTDILISKDDLDDGTRPQLWITVFIIAFLVFL